MRSGYIADAKSSGCPLDTKIVDGYQVWFPQLMSVPHGRSRCRAPFLVVVTALTACAESSNPDISVGFYSPGSLGPPGSAGGSIGEDGGAYGPDSTADGALVAAPGDDAGSGPCDPTTCPKGCCDVSGSCVAGTVDMACGVGGLSCVSCAAFGQVCQGGSCSATVATGGIDASGASTSTGATGGDDAGSGPCDSTTCPNGCCDASGTCVSGTDDTACGMGGMACVDCTASGQVCPSGACAGTGDSRDGGFRSGDGGRHRFDYDASADAAFDAAGGKDTGLGD